MFVIFRERPFVRRWERGRQIPSPIPSPTTSAAEALNAALGKVMQGVINDSKLLGYTFPGEPLSRQKNFQTISAI